MTGTVIKNGQPVANASITFYASAGRPSYGTSDGEGKYRLEYSQDVEGAVVGEHKVVIIKSGMGPPSAEETAEPSMRSPSRPQRPVDTGPMEVTLPDMIQVTEDMGPLDLVIP